MQTRKDAMSMLAVTAAVAGRADAFIARCTRSSVLAGLLALILVTDRHRSCPLAAGLTDQRRTGAAGLAAEDEAVSAVEAAFMRFGGSSFNDWPSAGYFLTVASGGRPFLIGLALDVEFADG